MRFAMCFEMCFDMCFEMCFEMCLKLVSVEVGGGDGREGTVFCNSSAMCHQNGV